MNVMGLPDRELITLCETSDYFFGVSSEIFDKAEQCGVYHRGMVGVRFEQVDAQAVEALHTYFEWLISRHKSKRIEFGLLTSVRTTSD